MVPVQVEHKYLSLVMSVPHPWKSRYDRNAYSEAREETHRCYDHGGGGMIHKDQNHAENEPKESGSCTS